MKKRLDVILVNQGYASSREKAKSLIVSGQVTVNGKTETKPGFQIEEEQIQIEIKGSQLKYVGRGGLKLEKAIECWGIDLSNCICMDIGASTGGFTDCMLQNGAAKVYSVDVGKDQLAQSLREDKRVVCMEETNFRYMKPEDIQELPDFAGVDVSFISLTKILVPARALLQKEGKMVCLIKPQFEAGKDKVGKKGVVKEAGTHEQVLHKIVDFACLCGFQILDLDFSPIKGPEGNIEYLVYLKKDMERDEEKLPLAEKDAEELLEIVSKDKTGISREGYWNRKIKNIVAAAHDNLQKSD